MESLHRNAELQKQAGRDCNEKLQRDVDLQKVSTKDTELSCEVKAL